MMRRFIPPNPAFIISIASALAVLSGCQSREDVSHETEYREFIGQTYRLKEAVYIVEFTDGSGKPGMLMPATEAESDSDAKASEDKVGTTYPSGVVIKGVLPADTQIRITKVIEDKNPEMGTTIDFLVEPLGELQEEWPTLNAGFIQKALPNEDEGLDPEYVERVEE